MEEKQDKTMNIEALRRNILNLIEAIFARKMIYNRQKIVRVL